jgi:hypothetical protein
MSAWSGTFLVGGGLPTTPVAGYQAWYDAADTGTFTIVSNRVSQWDDKSANGFNLTQGTAGDRPTYNAAPRTINGVTCPEFTTGGEFLESSCPADDRTSTTFVVGLCDSVAAARCVFGDTQGGGNELRLALTTGVVQTLKSGVSILASHLVVVAGIRFILAQRLSATVVQTDYMFSRFPTSESSTFTAGRTLRIGMDTSGTVFWDGLIAEFIRYDTTLSDADLNETFLYLLNKWPVE